MFADRTNWNLTPNRLSEALARRRALGLPLLDLTASNPTECGFLYQNEAILEALANPAALAYHPESRGLPAARDAVAAYYARHGAAVSPADIVLTTGTSEAYSFLFRLLCNPGDEFLVPQPGYPLLDFLAEIHDVRLVRYALLYDHGWQIDFHSLERAITPRTRGIAVVHPNNPTGHFVAPEETQLLNRLCAAHHMAIVADEVFLDFALPGAPPTTFAANSAALTFTLSGLSKICGLPQMKVAWLVAGGPEEWKSQSLARLEVIADTYLSMNAPLQCATAALLVQRHAFQSQVMSRIQINLDALDHQLIAVNSCSRLRWDAGWCVVLRVPASRSDEDIAVELLATKGVHIHPGSFYGFPPSGYLVASLIVPEIQLKEGIDLLLSAF
jgi:alanine-synthesizing transaminase